MIRRYCSKCNRTQKDIKYTSEGCCKKCGVMMVLQCLKCKKQYSNYIGMKYHVQSKCNPLAHYFCSKCDYTCTLKDLMTRHIRSVHTVEATPAVCPKCDKQLKNRRCLGKHIKYCGKDPHLQCPQCSYVTRHTNNLRLHQRQHLLHDGELKIRGPPKKRRVDKGKSQGKASGNVLSFVNETTFIKDVIVWCSSFRKSETILSETIRLTIKFAFLQKESALTYTRF